MIGWLYSQRVVNSTNHTYVSIIDNINVAAKTAADVEGLFRVLRGADPLSNAIEILPNVNVLSEYQPEHDPQKWMACSYWCDWWTRKNHLSTLTIYMHSVYAS